MTSQERVDIFKAVLKMDTTLGNEKIAAEYIQSLFSKYPSVKIELIEYGEGRTQLVATMDGQKPGKVLAFSGHMDVVPVGGIKWEHDPFGAEEVDGKIYGRGATDMKSGLMAMICAMLELAEEKAQFNGSLRLLATVGEETSAIGALQLAKLGYAKDLDALILAEGTYFDVGIAHQGALWPRVTILGRTAHGSMPQYGINAVDHALLFIEAYKKKFDFSSYVDPNIGPSTSTLTVMRGGNATNVVPDECIMEFDIRTVKGEEHSMLKNGIQEVLDELAKTVEGFSGKVEYLNDLPSVSTNPEDTFVKVCCEVAEKHTGKPVKPRGGPGYTDASGFIGSKPDMAVVVFGPGNPTQAHQPNEHVETDKYLMSIDCFKDIAVNYLK